MRRIVVLVMRALVLAMVPVASAGTESCDERTNNTYQKLLDRVTVEGARAHQAAFQAAADANGGNRAAGTAGYDDSVDHVVNTLEAAGWTVELDEFPFLYAAPAVLAQLTPRAGSYETGAYTGTGYGDIAGNVVAVDLNLVPPRASDSGCEAADFAGFPAGSIALIRRGTCSFAIKAINAEAAGAACTTTTTKRPSSTEQIESGDGWPRPLIPRLRSARRSLVRHSLLRQRRGRYRRAIVRSRAGTSPRVPG